MTEMDGSIEGVSGNTPSYRERLWPSVGVWLFWLLMTTSLGIAYGRVYGYIIGIIIGILSSILAVIALSFSSPIIEVDELVVRAGAARLPLRFVGEIIELGKENTTQSLRNRAHHNAFFLTRGWIRESILIAVTDEQDPHPYWQISTRNPTTLSESIREAKLGAGGSSEQ